MATYEAKSENGTLVGPNLTRASGVVALAEGKPARGQVKPLELNTGESTVCLYPASVPGSDPIKLTITRID